MARCKDCIHDKVCDEWAVTSGIPFVNSETCEHFTPTADVVPKSEVERLEHILNSYALQYGTVKDQHEVIDKAKSEVAKEIFEEIENMVSPMLGLEDDKEYVAILSKNFAELKKKYAEEKDD